MTLALPRRSSLGLTLALILTTFPAGAQADDGVSTDFSLGASASGSTLTIELARTVQQSHFALSNDTVSHPDGSVIHTQRAVGPSFCDVLYREVVSNHPCWRYAPPSDEEPATPETVDPTRVLYSAVALASVDGAGLVVEPNRGWVYKDVPTLAHATHQQLTTSVSLFDLTIPVQFTATDYTFDFHSGNPPIHTSAPGAPYPDMSIQTVYTAETPHAHVTLTTLWDATVTHPTTGDTLTIPAALRTIENSPPFKVIPAKQRLISPNAPQPE